MTKDPELAEALDRGRALLGAGAPEATLVHDLAVEGARLLGDEHARRQRSLDQLADHGFLDRILDPDGFDSQTAEVLPVALFDRLSAVLGFDSQWIVPGGSA